MRPAILLCAVGASTPTQAFSPVPRGLNGAGASRHVHRGRASVSLKSTKEETGNNFFASLFQGATLAKPAETEEEKRRRLRRERLAAIEEGEVRRRDRVAEDAPFYLLLLSLQLLPLIESVDRHYASLAYFLGVACTTVYLGGRQEVIDAPERIPRDAALIAPITASLAIGGLYLLLKAGIDVTVLYAAGVTVFGALAVSDIGVPILRNLLPGVDFAEAEVTVPPAVAERLDLDKPALPLDGLITLGLGIAFTVAYWSPVAMEQKFLVSNVIAWAIGMVSLGGISLGSFQTGAILLAGLFCYDIFWVFGTGERGPPADRTICIPRWFLNVASLTNVSILNVPGKTS